MNSRLFSALASLTLSGTAFAGTMISPHKEPKIVEEPCPPVTTTWLSLKGSYTGSSDFERGNDASGDSFYKSAELTHRIPLGLFGGWPNIECSQWYLRLGADYRRWDFDNAGGLPIPNTLQSFAAVIALEYVIRDVAAITIEARPGFYFEHDVRSDSFNVPVTVYAPIWWHEGELSWALLAGFSYNGLRSHPFIPAAGLAVNYGKWTLLAVPPSPRLMYTANKEWTFWAEADVVGGAFRTDDHTFPRQENLNHAVVTYSEWRVGAGFTWKPCANAVIDLGAGYAFNRRFDFHRAEEAFETDGGAPYVKLEFRGIF